MLQEWKAKKEMIADRHMKALPKQKFKKLRQDGRNGPLDIEEQMEILKETLKAQKSDKNLMVRGCRPSSRQPLPW